MPWHVKGVRPEAREGAREAARRAGLSVGEWLNSVIIDSAAHAGVDMRDVEAIVRDLGLEHDDPDPLKASPADATPQDIAAALAGVNRRADTAPAAHQAAAAPRDPAALERALAALGRDRLRSPPAYSPVEEAVAEISRRQRQLDAAETAMPPSGGRPAARTGPAVEVDVGRPPDLDMAAIERHFQRLSERLQALQDSRPLDAAVSVLRSDLREIGQAIAEASPRQAIESLEAEMRTVAERLDAGRQAGNDDAANDRIARALADMRAELARLTPAEGLVEFGDAIKQLSQKIDRVAAGSQGPAAMQQAESSVPGLRGVASHAASDEVLAGLTAEVRSLSERVGQIQAPPTAPSNELLMTLVQRIATMTDSLQAERATAASSANIDAMMREIGEKIEELKSSRQDASTLGQIEQRVSHLADKIDASEARLGHLDTIERGMSELLSYFDGMRAGRTPGEPAPKARDSDAAPAPFDAGFMRVAPDQMPGVTPAPEPLDPAPGAIADVVDRLAMFESGSHGGGDRPAPARASEPPAPPAAAIAVPVQVPAILDVPLKVAANDGPRPLPPARPTRAPIEPALPPDRPLEPGSGPPRASMTVANLHAAAATAAERISASKAALDSVKPAAVEPEPKANFIMAARRAAQAAAEDRGLGVRAALGPAAGGAESLREKVTQHGKSLLVGICVIAILAGVLHFVANFLESREPAIEVPKPVSDSQSSPPIEAFAAVESSASGQPLPDPAPQAKVISVPDAPPAAPVAADSAPPTAAEPVVQSPDPAAAASAFAAPLVPSPPPQAAPAPAPAPALLPSAPAPARPAAAPQAADVAAPAARDAKPAPAATPLALAPSGAAEPAAVPDGSAGKLPPEIGGKALLVAAANGDPAAAYEVGIRFAEGRGVSTSAEDAARWLERAANAGLAPAQFRLGGMYEKGFGVKKDLVRARNLYVAAASAGNARAMHNLAVLYAEGLDGRPDYAVAIDWFRKAAARGVADSQFNLGVLYARGIGVPQDLSESFKWFALAAQQGDRDAAQKRDDIAKKLDPRTLDAARVAVQAWTAEPQPDDATQVRSPPGGWDQAPVPMPAPASKARRPRAAASIKTAVPL